MNLHNGDALEFIRSLPDSSVDLVLTSPPYNIGKEYEKEVEFIDYIAEQCILIKQLKRVLKKTGSVCWQVGEWHGLPLDLEYYQVFKEIGGFQLRNRIVWYSRHGIEAKRYFSRKYETILWYTISDDYVFNLDPVRVPARYPSKTSTRGKNKGKNLCNPLGKNPDDVWDIPRVKAQHPEKTAHPCQFPLELAERCILALTNEGDVVLDPYLGSGTTAVAALKWGRIPYGSERHAPYFDIMHDRIEQLKDGTLKYREPGKPQDPQGPFAVIPDWYQAN